MKQYFPIILWGLLVALIHAEDPWWKVFGDIQVGNFAGGHHDGEDKLDKQIETLLQATKFDEWETYEDDLVKLSYPKHESLRLKIKGGEDGINVEGGVCTTVGNSFQRASSIMPQTCSRTGPPWKS